MGGSEGGGALLGEGPRRGEGSSHRSGALVAEAIEASLEGILAHEALLKKEREARRGR